MESKKFIADELLEEITTNEDIESRENAERILNSAIGKNKYFKGICERCKPNGDLIVNYNGVECIIKRAEVSNEISPETGQVHKRICQDLVGSAVAFMVLHYQNDTFYCSRKRVLAKNRKKINDTLEVNDRITGIISAIDDNIGCFVNIGGDYKAVLPKSKLEYCFVSNIINHVHIGEIVECIVSDIVRDVNNNITEIVLNRKAALPPYEELISKYKPLETIVGIVQEKKMDRVYVQLDKHLTAICSFPKNVLFAEGDRVRLQLKRLYPNPQKKIQGNILSKC